VSVALVLVAAVTAGVVAATSGGARRVEVAHSPKEVEPARLNGFDAVVVLPAGATADDADRMATILDESSAVGQYAALPAVGLALSLGADAEALRLVDRVCADPSTRSFAVKTASAEAIPALQEAAASRATVLPVFTRGAFDVEIDMKVAATAEQTEAIQTALQQDPDVAGYRFTSHQDAYEEFRRLFADQPDLIESEAADGSGLPETFRLTVSPGASAAAVADRYDRLPGVDEAKASVWLHTLSEVCALRHSSP
jgi:hypothetical protein